MSPEWQSRLRFEGARRDHMDAVNLRRLAGEEPTRRDTACTAACTGQQMCWQGQCTSSPTLTFIDDTTQVTCTLAAVVPVTSANTAINVLVDTQDATANPNAVTQAVAAATLFASTFSTELQLLGRTGHVPPVDVDGDGRMTMVFTSQNGQAANADDNSNLAGFFSIADVLNPNSSLDGVQADGNQADLLWVRVPGTTLGTGTLVTPLLLAGTMAHEYTHLTSFAVRVLGSTPPLGREELWLDEGMAHTMEDLTGWGPSTVRVVQSALNDWTKTSVFASGTDSIDQRGAAYTLVRYLIDQAAKAAGASSAADSTAMQAAGSFLGALIQENALGYAHQPFASLGDSGLFNWLTGLQESGSTAGLTAAHAYDYLPTGTNAVTNNIIGFNPRGTYSDSSAESLSLSGACKQRFGCLQQRSFGCSR